MRIEQVMHKQVDSVKPDQSLNDAARILWERDCGCLPVVCDDASRRVVAMLTDRDICMAAYLRGRPLAELPVHGAMSHELHACSPEDSIEEAEALMRRAQVRRLPVVDASGQLVGIVSLSDLARAAEAGRGPKQALRGEAEVGATLAAICAPRPASEGALANP
jgi:CBS-domain-containing membrane protein